MIILLEYLDFDYKDYISNKSIIKFYYVKKVIYDNLLKEGNLNLEKIEEKFQTIESQFRDKLTRDFKTQEEQANLY